MKVIELTQSQISLNELLETACQETVILRKTGDKGFVLAAIDEFDLEVELLRHNAEFMGYLDELSKHQATLSIEDVEKELGL